jgi:hypothetical protein
MPIKNRRNTVEMSRFSKKIVHTFLFLHSACIPHEEKLLFVTSLVAGFANRIAFLRGLGGQGTGEVEGGKDFIVGFLEIGAISYGKQCVSRSHTIVNANTHCTQASKNILIFASKKRGNQFLFVFTASFCVSCL